MTELANFAKQSASEEILRARAKQYFLPRCVLGRMAKCRFRHEAVLNKYSCSKNMLVGIELYGRMAEW